MVYKSEMSYNRLSVIQEKYTQKNVHKIQSAKVSNECQIMYDSKGGVFKYGKDQPIET